MEVKIKELEFVRMFMKEAQKMAYRKLQAVVYSCSEEIFKESFQKPSFATKRFNEGYKALRNLLQTELDINFKKFFVYIDRNLFLSQHGKIDVEKSNIRASHYILREKYRSTFLRYCRLTFVEKMYKPVLKDIRGTLFTLRIAIQTIEESGGTIEHLRHQIEAMRKKAKLIKSLCVSSQDILQVIKSPDKKNLQLMNDNLTETGKRKAENVEDFEQWTVSKVRLRQPIPAASHVPQFNPHFSTDIDVNTVKELTTMAKQYI